MNNNNADKITDDLKSVFTFNISMCFEFNIQ